MSTTTTEPTMLPVLTIEARGEIVKSNFDEFATAIRTRLKEFNLELRTDEDFDQAAEDIKRLKSAEDALKAAEESAFDDGDMARLKANLRALKTEISTARLTITRQADERKAFILANMINGALCGIDASDRIRAKFRADMEAAIKGCKSFNSMREKLRVAVQVANDRIGRCKRQLDKFEKEHGTAMTADRATLETGDPVVLESELKLRAERKAAEEYAAKLRAEAEKAKAEEAAAKAALEAEKAKPANVVTMPQSESKPVASKPDPATVTDMPWDPPQVAEISQEQEWIQFRGVLNTVFCAVREIRGKLIHPRNRAMAESFAKACGEAMARIEKGGAA